MKIVYTENVISLIGKYSFNTASIMPSILIVGMPSLDTISSVYILKRVLSPILGINSLFIMVDTLEEVVLLLSNNKRNNKDRVTIILNIDECLAPIVDSGVYIHITYDMKKSLITENSKTHDNYFMVESNTLSKQKLTKLTILFVLEALRATDIKVPPYIFHLGCMTLVEGQVYEIISRFEYDRYLDRLRQLTNTHKKVAEPSFPGFFFSYTALKDSVSLCIPLNKKLHQEHPDETMRTSQIQNLRITLGLPTKEWTSAYHTLNASDRCRVINTLSNNKALKLDRNLMIPWRYRVPSIGGADGVKTSAMDSFFMFRSLLGRRRLETTKLGKKEYLLRSIAANTKIGEEMIDHLDCWSDGVSLADQRRALLYKSMSVYKEVNYWLNQVFAKMASGGTPHKADSFIITLPNIQIVYLVSQIKRYLSSFVYEYIMETLAYTSGSSNTTILLVYTTGLTEEDCVVAWREPIVETDNMLVQSMKRLAYSQTYCKSDVYFSKRRQYLVPQREAWYILENSIQTSRKRAKGPPDENENRQIHKKSNNNVE